VCSRSLSLSPRRRRSSRAWDGRFVRSSGANVLPPIFGAPSLARNFDSCPWFLFLFFIFGCVPGIAKMRQTANNSRRPCLLLAVRRGQYLTCVFWAAVWGCGKLDACTGR
jgi:hypothetical protein